MKQKNLIFEDYIFIGEEHQTTQYKVLKEYFYIFENKYLE